MQRLLEQTLVVITFLFIFISGLAFYSLQEYPPRDTVSVEVPEPNIRDSYISPLERKLSLWHVEAIAETVATKIPRFYEDFEWLRLNIYWEDRQHGFKSMLGVGFVTLNRVKDPRYDNTVKEVVTQAVVRNGTPVRNKCHFSWYCNGLSDDPNLDHKAEYEAWLQASKAAKQILLGEVEDFTNGALYYHADYVNPHWSNEKYVTRVATVGKHIFYTRNN